MFQFLIVDDEPSVVDTIAHTMPWEELLVDEVFCAYSAREALRIVNQNHIDIVMTDIRMPGIDGLQMIEQITSKSTHAEIILLTGYDEFDYAKKALQLQVADYLLKPVRDEVLIETIGKITNRLKQKWEQISSQQTAMKVLRSHLPLLQEELLENILTGTISEKEWEEKCEVLELPFTTGDEAFMLVLRLEGKFSTYNTQDLLLMENAIINIAEEILSPAFQLWHCKDPHDFLVVLLKPLDRKAEAIADTVSRLSGHLQKSVHTYLKGNISIVIAQPGLLPDGLRQPYQMAVQTMRRYVGKDSGLVLSTQQKEGQAPLLSANILHEPPSLMHLFEAGQWDAVCDKLSHFFAELEQKQIDSPDLLAELYHTLTAACYRYAHLNGTTLQQLLQGFGEQDELPSLNRLMTLSSFKQWAYDLCEFLLRENQQEIKNDRRLLIEKLQEYIHFHLQEDVSLQTLADYVHLHPVYLSKIFKMETGEGLKEYLFRVRMDKAVQLLKHSDTKIYKITEKIGYMNTTYFIKVFKKHFGMTPQEYRDSHQA